MTKNKLKFINGQICTNVCCIGLQPNNSYYFSCYYAFNSEDGLLVFKSSETTQHDQLINKNPFVSGTILPDKLAIR